MPSLEDFLDIMGRLTRHIAGRRLDADLERELNATFPPASGLYEEILSACRAGSAAGWMCAREAGGIKFGRVIKPGPATHGFSVDVVDMDRIVGPHHSHPNGEIDLVMPLTPGAQFDGHGAGWCVY